MKKLILTLVTLGLVACDGIASISKNDISILIPSNISAHEYDEIADYTIGFTEIFEVNIAEYYVYFYSPVCAHCTSIKDYVIHYALNAQNFRFISPDTTNAVPTTTNINSNLGATTINDIRITGYPCMFKISDKTISGAYSGTINITGELFKT